MTTVRKTYESPRATVKGRRGTALVSVFSNVDYQGDRVMPGAFAASLERWRDSGDPIPIIFSHQWGEPWSHVGWTTAARETADGLVLDFELDDEAENPVAGHIGRLLADRRLREWSFGYDILRERQGADGANELLELEIIEAGPTLKGANPATETLGMKSALDRMVRDRSPHLIYPAGAGRAASPAAPSATLADQAALIARGLDPELVTAAFGAKADAIAEGEAEARERRRPAQFAELIAILREKPGYEHVAGAVERLERLLPSATDATDEYALDLALAAVGQLVGADLGGILTDYSNEALFLRHLVEAVELLEGRSPTPEAMEAAATAATLARQSAAMAEKGLDPDLLRAAFGQPSSAEVQVEEDRARMEADARAAERERIKGLALDMSRSTMSVPDRMPSDFAVFEKPARPARFDFEPVRVPPYFVSG